MDDKNNKVVFDDVEYNWDDLTDEQKRIVNHLSNLEQKIANLQFNLEQMVAGKDMFVHLFKQSVEAKDEKVSIAS